MDSMEFQEQESFVGTALYMAPEQIKGLKCSYSVDLWAFGLIIYKMFTKKNLFKTQNEF